MTAVTASIADTLTRRQRDILTFIVDYGKTNGYPPSMREIGAEVGLASVSSVRHQLLGLEAKGWIRRDPSRPRTIVLKPSGGA